MKTRCNCKKKDAIEDMMQMKTRCKKIDAIEEEKIQLKKQVAAVKIYKDGYERNKDVLRRKKMQLKESMKR